ncbi:site-2 protease family protein [Candidatus Bathyarchaeota archaeon]|nr:site-2 protease family protein [Candidatus Bathyarchaeota archaeon]
MSETPNENFLQPSQTDFEKFKMLVSEHFQLDDALIEHDVPTFYLKQPQETKQAFLKLLRQLETMGFIAFLRKSDGKLVLKIFPKPPSKPSNTRINWLLFFATIGTTFATGYLLAEGLASIGGAIDPIIGGFMFTIAIMAILGLHEMGHKLTANKSGIDATPPYFIPGPPINLGGFGTFGAVILQKSLPPNKDVLFDIGLSGPIVSFIMAVIATAIGSTMAVNAPLVEGATSLPTPLIAILIWRLFLNVGLIQIPSSGQLYMHPVEFAGWVGLLVTALNLLPVAMLDGGHIARAIVGDKVRTILAMISILLLIVGGFWLMAVFILLLSMQRHPGPLDDVSTLSFGRKLLAAALVVVFVLSFPLF